MKFDLRAAARATALVALYGVLIAYAPSVGRELLALLRP